MFLESSSANRHDTGGCVTEQVLAWSGWVFDTQNNAQGQPANRRVLVCVCVCVCVFVNNLPLWCHCSCAICKREKEACLCVFVSVFVWVIKVLQQALSIYLYRSKKCKKTYKKLCSIHSGLFSISRPIFLTLISSNLTQSVYIPFSGCSCSDNLCFCHACCLSLSASCVCDVCMYLSASVLTKVC